MKTDRLAKAAHAAWGTVTQLVNGPAESIGAMKVVLKESPRTLDGIPMITKNSVGFDSSI